MKERIMRSIRREEGQGMTEYIIIVALIAIAAIGVVTIFGDNIRDLFGASASALSGETASRRVEQHSNIAEHAELDSFTAQTGDATADTGIQ